MSDLTEMIDSENGEKLNIVVQTGGAKEWSMEDISSEHIQRWLIQNGEMQLCESLPNASMCSQKMLTDFINWGASEYPADRYMLVLWDHGSGTMYGYGYDENYPDDDSMSLHTLRNALADTEIKMDLVGFDACLMGTLETAYAFEPYADYLLASEETEPADGWNYTSVLKKLSKEPDMSTVELGARFIDDYCEFYEEEEQSDITLSLIELREIPALYEACGKYYENAAKNIANESQQFSDISVARSHCRNYAEGEAEQIDLVDYVQRTQIDGAKEVIDKAFSAVVYYNESALSGSYGLAIYFPYSSPEEYANVKSELDELSYHVNEDFYDSFLSVLASAQNGNDISIDGISIDEDSYDCSDEDWFDSAIASDYSYDTINGEEDLVVDYDEKLDAYLLDLPEEDWEKFVDIQLQVMLDDGEGYIDLGSDQTYEWTDDGKLILDFDGSWVSINGNLAAYYAFEPVEDGKYTIFTGTTPAILNDDTQIDIYLSWKMDQSGNTQASVLGYLPVDETAVRPKGYFPLKENDEIQLICDYYTYDGEYEASYALSDPFTVSDQKDLVVDYYEMEGITADCWFMLTDYFKQQWYTEAIEITYE